MKDGLMEGGKKKTVDLRRAASTPSPWESSPDELDGIKVQS